MPTRPVSPSACSLLATLVLGLSASAEPTLPTGSTPSTHSTARARSAPESSERAESLREQSSTSGGTGLLHLQDPTSSVAGTFRMSLLFDSYKGSGFLCNAATPCPGVQED